ncbi:MAG: nitrite reductase [Burkholderiales bacterium]|nr:nitrite reductase [Burkholderiales bacterium]
MRSVPIACALIAYAAPAIAAPDAASDYRQHCAACHGTDRLGGIGPALLPDNLERLKRGDAVKVVTHGRVATQMPGFAASLSAEQIEALVAHVYTPLPVMPQWGMDEIRATRIEHAPAEPTATRPVHDADPLNLFVVVEAGDHHVTILDGDRLEPLARFASRYALHGGPKFTPDGRFVFFASRDGWVSKYDLWTLSLIAEVRVGINTRNVAVSGDGRYVMAGNYLPHTLVALDARTLQPIRVIEVRDREGRSSRVSGVYDAAPRRSFVAALKDIPELWELTYDDHAEPVYDGYVHDYRSGEGIAVPGPFPPRRTKLDDILDDFFFDPSYAYVIGASRDGGRGQVVNLDVRRKIAEVPLPGLPHLASGISWIWRGRTILATPNLKEGVVSVIDMKTWKPIKEIPTPGPGFFLRSHEASRYAWVDAFNSPHRDTLQVIDKETLEPGPTLTPAPGKIAAHVEFSRDGRYALASVWDMEGAIVVYDAATLTEVKRLPMVKPVGKYNVFNKIMHSSGTSH